MDVQLLFGPKYWLLHSSLFSCIMLYLPFILTLSLYCIYQPFCGSQYPMQETESSVGISAGKNLMQLGPWKIAGRSERMDSNLSLQKWLWECYIFDPSDLLLPPRPPLKLGVQEHRVLAVIQEWRCYHVCCHCNSWHVKRHASEKLCISTTSHGTEVSKRGRKMGSVSLPPSKFHTRASNWWNVTYTQNSSYKRCFVCLFVLALCHLQLEERWNGDWEA